MISLEAEPEIIDRYPTVLTFFANRAKGNQYKQWLEEQGHEVVACWDEAWRMEGQAETEYLDSIADNLELVDEVRMTKSDRVGEWGKLVDWASALHGVEVKDVDYDDRGWKPRTFDSAEVFKAFVEMKIRRTSIRLAPTAGMGKTIKVNRRYL